MQAVIGDDPFDAALANGVALLADFLSDDFGGGSRIQEAAADDQAHDLIGAAVIGFWSRGLQEQALGALLEEVGQDLDELDSKGRDPKYVETIVARSKKTVAAMA